jgi:hypothetical protein
MSKMPVMNEKSIKYLPFNALNQWMRPDYRELVVSTVLQNLNTLGDPHKKTIHKLIKQYVQVPGFRNSTQAPGLILVRGTITGFEKHAGLTAAILSAWSQVQSDLRQKVYQVLLDRGWELLPPEADRTRLPGFLTTWPKNEDFEVIQKDMEEKYPEESFVSDDVSLMAVWVSGRIPLEIEED